MEDKLMAMIANKISDELDWSSYVDEKEKKIMVEEVMDTFTKMMTASIVNIVE